MRKITFFLLLLILYNQLGVDIYLPSMPAMAKDLATGFNSIQLTLTLFFLGFSVSTLFYGAIGGSCGRRPLLLFGTALFCVGSVLCAASPTIGFLLAARFIQGVGSSAPSVLSRAVMRDVFEGPALVRLASYRSMVWITVPVLAPLLGGYIQEGLGWRWNFILLAILSFVVFLLVYFWLPETYEKSRRRPLQLRHIVSDYLVVVRSRTFWGYLTLLMLTYAMLVTYDVISPYLFQTKLGLSASHFGWMLAFTSLGYFLGSYTNSLLTGVLSSHSAMKLGLLGALLSALPLLFGPLTIWAIAVPIFFLLFSIGWVYPHCIAGSMAPFREVASSAAALASGVVFAGSSAITAIAARLPETTQVPMAAMLLVLGLLAVVCGKSLLFRGSGRSLHRG